MTQRDESALIQGKKRLEFHTSEVKVSTTFMVAKTQKLFSIFQLTQDGKFEKKKGKQCKTLESTSTVLFSVKSWFVWTSAIGSANKMHKFMMTQINTCYF